MKNPAEMNLFELAELLRRDKAAGLKELTLRFRRAAKEASKRSHALGLEVYDGRAGEPLPVEENWEGTPVGENRKLRGGKAAARADLSGSASANSEDPKPLGE